MSKKTIIIIAVVVFLVAGGIFAFINYEHESYTEEDFTPEEREEQERRDVEEKVEETKEAFIFLAEKIFALEREEVGADTLEEVNEKFEELDRGLTQLDEDYVRGEVTSEEFIERMNVFLQEIKDLTEEVEEM